MMLAATPSSAFTLSWPQDWDYQFEANWGSRHVNLDPRYPTYLPVGSSQANVAKSLIEAQWQSWNVSVSTLAADGAASVLSYRVDLTLTQAKAKFRLLYTGDPLWSTDRFIQVVWASDINNGAPFLDPSPNDDNLPFYYTEAENATARNGNNYQFYDSLWRDYDGTQAYQWHAAMFLTEWTSAGPYVYLAIRDGVLWGWETVGTQGGGGGEMINQETSSPVPEPASLLGLFVGVAVLIRRRNRC